MVLKSQVLWDPFSVTFQRVKQVLIFRQTLSPGHSTYIALKSRACTHAPQKMKSLTEVSALVSAPAFLIKPNHMASTVVLSGTYIIKQPRSVCRPSSHFTSIYGRVFTLFLWTVVFLRSCPHHLETCVYWTYYLLNKQGFCYINIANKLRRPCKAHRPYLFSYYPKTPAQTKSRIWRGT